MIISRPSGGSVKNQSDEMEIITNSDLKLITERNVYEVSSLLNFVIFCEYCDILFHITNIMRSNLDTENPQEKQYSHYQTNTLIPIIEVLQKMASTLVKL